MALPANRCFQTCSVLLVDTYQSSASADLKEIPTDRSLFCFPKVLHPVPQWPKHGKLQHSLLVSVFLRTGSDFHPGGGGRCPVLRLLEGGEGQSDGRAAIRGHPTLPGRPRLPRCHQLGSGDGECLFVVFYACIVRRVEIRMTNWTLGRKSSVSLLFGKFPETLWPQSSVFRFLLVRWWKFELKSNVFVLCPRTAKENCNLHLCSEVLETIGFRVNCIQ